MATLYDDDLRLSHVLADIADRITMSRFKNQDLHVSSKPDMTPVSEADTLAEESIRSQLARSRPRDSFAGEESGVTGTATRRWIVDPIDGTKNFIRGVPVWGTLIALVDNVTVSGEGEEPVTQVQPVLGIVSAPALHRRWWAAVGTGAWTGRNLTSATRIRVSDVARIEDATLSYSALPRWKDIDRYQDMLSLIDDCHRTRAYGDFWSYMLVAEGALDIAAEPSLAVHDMAALAPIVTEAGGAFTSLRGIAGPWDGTALATNGLLHEEVLERIGLDRQSSDSSPRVEALT